jgi:hypothetical protein
MEKREGRNQKTAGRRWRNPPWRDHRRLTKEQRRGVGGGVISDVMPFETPVIPAKAGIQSVGSAFPKVSLADSRFRGNDRGLQRPCLANDTSTPPWRDKQ